LFEILKKKIKKLYLRRVGKTLSLDEQKRQRSLDNTSFFKVVKMQESNSRKKNSTS